MLVGNAMTVTGVTMKKLREDVKMQRNLIALSPIIGSAKAVGLITLPGTMTGLIMAGASPLEAIQLEIVVTNTLMGACTVSSILCTAPSSAGRRSSPRPSSSRARSLLTISDCNVLNFCKSRSSEKRALKYESLSRH
ncbi:hypothetical protein EJB05_34198, partial [Eragrostis curvula]